MKTNTLMLFPPMLMLVIGCAAGCAADRVEDASGEPAAAQVPVAQAQFVAAIPDDLTGEWVNSRFIELLKQSRSIRQAIEDLGGDAVLWMRIAEHDGGIELTRSWDLHDSGTERIDTLIRGERSNTVLLQRRNRVDTVGVEPGLLHWGGAGGPQEPVTFVRIDGALGGVINAALIAGSYRGQGGKRYEFFENGTAIWEGDTVDYQIHTDLVENASPGRFNRLTLRRGDRSTQELLFDWNGSAWEFLDAAQKRVAVLHPQD